jgi:hypothetical protein
MGMKVALPISNATYINIEELRANLAELLEENDTLVITDEGVPRKIIMSCNNITEFLNTLKKLFAN